MKRFPRWSNAAVAAGLLSLLVGGALVHRGQKAAGRSGAESELAGIAEAKVRQIAQWRAERLGDAGAIAAMGVVRDAVVRWFRDGEPEAARSVADVLRSMSVNQHYADGFLVDVEGKVRLGLKDHPAEAPDRLGRTIAEAIASRQVRMTDLHLDAGGRVPYLEVVAPLFAGAKGEGAALGAVVLTVDARQFIFAVTQSWPNPSRTGEALFVRREGEEVLYLNDLRFHPEAALRLRVPLTARGVPAVEAVLGKEGLMEGRDYRDVPVLAALAAIPESPWYIVAKVDIDEAFAEWRVQSVLILALLVLITAVLFLVGGLGMQQRSKLRVLAESAEALRQSEERLRLALEGVKDHAVFLLDPAGRVASWNPGLQRQLGYVAEEILGRETGILFPSAAVDAGDPARLLAAAEREGNSEDQGWRLRKDGSRFWAEVMIGALRDAAGNLRGYSCVIRDISVRKGAEEAIQSRLRLMEAAPTRTTDEFLQFALDEIETRTGSTVGFCHFLGEDQETLTLQVWSTNTVGHMCTAVAKGTHYPVSKAGVWVDCVRQGRPVIHNDYAALPHKKGLPEGHSPVVRELVVPLIRKQRIVAIVGVGNKPAPYDEADAEVVTLLGDFSWEIVERKRAEAALVASERRLRLATETAGIGIWDWDLERNTVEWDAQMFRLYGLSVREGMLVDYRDWAEAVHPDDLSETERILAETARNGGRSAREFRIRCGGAIRHIQAAEQCVTDSAGRRARVVGVNLDVTSRKRAEAEQQQSLSLLQATLQASTDGILVVDSSGRITGGNQRFADMWPIPASLLAGRNDGPVWAEVAQRLKHPAAFLARVQEAAADPSSDSSGDLELSSGRMIEWFSRPQRVDGRPVGRVWSIRDVTAHKRAESAQQQLLAELARSNTDLEQFAYVASHDLKSPLRAIDSLASWLQEDLAASLDEASRSHFDLLRQRTKRMERLLDDLLAYSRAGRGPAVLAPVNLDELIAEVVGLIDLPAGFTVSVLPPAPTFTTVVTPLRHVLTNLVANAVKHHDRKSGIVEVAVREVGDFFEFAVADDGPGIPPQFHERIFGMFQTLRPRDEVEGSGIGLALVRRIVTRYGGTVAVECPRPRGSLFRFTWPKRLSHHGSA